MKRIKILWVISAAFNLIFLICIVYKIYNEYKKYADSKKPHAIVYHFKRDKLFEVLPPDSNAIVFIGNSLTQHFELSEFFKGKAIKNRGISADVIDGVINRIGPIVKTKPSKIFIEIGINDLGTGSSADSIVLKYKKLLNILRTQLPQTKIYVQSIFPTEIDRTEFPAYCTKKINDDVVAINKELSAFCKSKKFSFIDTYSSFVLNENLNPAYSIDGLHLSGQGYLLWAKILQPYIEE